MEWIREPMEVNMPKSVSWCPCMGAKCRGNNPPFCSIKTSNCKSVQTERLKQALQKAEAVIIGAGAGLSTSAGFTYSGDLKIPPWLSSHLFCLPCTAPRLKVCSHSSHNFVYDVELPSAMALSS